MGLIDQMNESMNVIFSVTFNSGHTNLNMISTFKFNTKTIN